MIEKKIAERPREQTVETSIADVIDSVMKIITFMRSQKFNKYPPALSISIAPNGSLLQYQYFLIIKCMVSLYNICYRNNFRKRFLKKKNTKKSLKRKCFLGNIGIQKVDHLGALY